MKNISFLLPTTSGRKGRALLGALTLAAGFPAAFAQNGSAEEADVVLEQFTVTGSRIKRIDTETPAPVIRLSTADFESTGFSTLGDAVRAMPIMNGTSLTSVDAGTSFTPGVSSFNLRGLGNNNTLVLINGRRAAPYGSAGFNGFQTVFDLNSIPVAAIDSLEVLKDGASAIYGSDAVAGVVNINLKNDFEGLTTEISIGNTLDTDSFEKGAFMIFGTSNEKSSIITTLDYKERNSIYARDLDYVAFSDGSPYGGFNQGSSRTPIANVRGLTDRVMFPAGRATFPSPTSNPTLADATPNVPIYNFQEEAGFFPDTRTVGFYTRATYELSDTITAFAEASYRGSETIIDAAATPFASGSENGDGPGGNVQFPATNPYNPFGQDIQDIRWRMIEVGNRSQNVNADTSRLLLGLEGTIPSSDWTWEAATLYTKNEVADIGLNYVQDQLVQDAFNGVIIDGELLYANPFGPNDPRIIDYMRVDNPNYDSYEIRSTDFSVGGNLFELPAGHAGVAFGGEYRTEELINRVNGLNETDQLGGGGSGTGTTGDRSVAAAFAELSLPVHDMLEVQLAARFEEYSDFGTTVKPKIAAVFRPMDELLIRGSFGQSFLAPNLPYLYTSRSVSFSANTIADPLRPNDPRDQIRQFGGGNPDLQPEESDITYIGVVAQPFVSQRDSLFRELSFGVDYIHYDQTDLLGRLSATDILSDLDSYSDLVLRNTPAPGETIGTINGVLTTWQNLNEATYSAYDFNVRWVLPENSLGQFRFEASWTYLADYDFNGLDQDGTYNLPLNRGNFTMAWKKGDWSTAIYVNHIGAYEDNFAIQDVGEQVLINPQIAYSGYEDTKITFGVRNALDRAPPRDLSDAKLVNEGVNNPEPLFWYLRVSRNW